LIFLPLFLPLSHSKEEHRFFTFDGILQFGLLGLMSRLERVPLLLDLTNELRIFFIGEDRGELSQDEEGFVVVGKHVGVSHALHSRQNTNRQLARFFPLFPRLKNSFHLGQVLSHRACIYACFRKTTKLLLSCPTPTNLSDWDQIKK